MERIRSIVRSLVQISQSPRARHEVAWNIVAQGTLAVCNFALLKLLTKTLTQSDFGVFNLCTTAVLFATHLLVTPLRQAYYRGFHGYETNNTARHAGVLCLRLHALIPGVATVLVLFTSRWIASLIDLPARFVVLIAVLFYVTIWQYASWGVLCLQRQWRRYAIQSSTWILLRLTLTAAIFFVWFPSVSGALLAYVLACIISGSLSVPPLLRYVYSRPAGPRSDLARSSCVYGIPLGILGVFGWVQTYGARYFLAALDSLSTAGIYAALVQIYEIPFTLLYMFLTNLLQPIAFKSVTNVQDADQLRKGTRLLLMGMGVYLGMAVPGALFLGLFGQSLVVLCTRHDYAVSHGIILFIAFSACVKGLGDYLDLMFMTHQRSGRLLAMRFVGSAVLAGACMLFVPRYGLIGAAMAGFTANTAYLALVLFERLVLNRRGPQTTVETVTSGSKEEM